MRKYLIALGCALGIACDPGAPSGPKIAFTSSACVNQDAPQAGTVRLTGGPGRILLEQRLSYVCCANIDIQLQRDGSQLRFVETNIGQVCRCQCNYDLTATATGLTAGTYQVQVLGVQYQAQPGAVLGQAEVVVTP